MIRTCSEGIYCQSAVRPQAVKNVATTSSVESHRESCATNPSFSGIFSSWNLKTRLESKSDRKIYVELSRNLDSEGKKMLEYLLKNGTLMKTDSYNQTTLSNLYKIIATERAAGLDNKVLLKNTISAIANPYSISQILGDIPNKYETEVTDIVLNDSLKRETEEKQVKQSNSVLMKGAIIPSTYDKSQVTREINNIHSGCCVAASIQFNLASENPAEYTRFAEALSSKSMSVVKEIKLDSISENTLDTLWLLNAFEIPHEVSNFKTAKLRLSPDKNALVRAKIQTTNQDLKERSPLDVLMQSTFMNVGSQQTYDTITDTRAGKFSTDTEGLIDIEKTFVESVVNDRNITSVLYQTIEVEEQDAPKDLNADENGKIYKQKLTGYELSGDIAKKQIVESLKSGKNVVVGYTFTDENNYIVGGHEVTISGIRVNKDGKEEFIINDTDSEGYNTKQRKNVPKYVEVTEFIPKIHHAGIPTEIAMQDTSYPESWVTAVDDFQLMLNSKKGQI